MGQDAPDGPRLRQVLFEGVTIWPRDAKDGPRWPNMAPRCPQDGPRWPQHGPDMTQDGPEMAQDGPGWPQEGPRWPRMAPGRAHLEPKLGRQGVQKGAFRLIETLFFEFRSHLDSEEVS